MAKKSKMKGYAIIAALIGGGAWFHAPILDFLHKYGIAKDHK